MHLARPSAWPVLYGLRHVSPDAMLAEAAFHRDRAAGAHVWTPKGSTRGFPRADRLRAGLVLLPVPLTSVQRRHVRIARALCEAAHDLRQLGVGGALRECEQFVLEDTRREAWDERRGVVYG